MIKSLSDLIGTKIKIQRNERKFKIRNIEYTLPSYEILDKNFESMIQNFTSDYKIYLPCTNLSPDSKAKTNIYIDPTGKITNITRH